MPNVLAKLKPIIVFLRRKENVDASWAAFREIVEGDTDQVCKELTTRWLVSVADTYIDMGTEIERRNAMFITMLCNLEKVSQTFLHWRVNYENPFDVPAEYEPRKIRLWDGMTSMHLDIGDVTNNLFRRLHPLLEPTPHLFRIFQEVVARMKTHPTTMAALDRRHHHVFEPELSWRAGPEYDRWRASGELPLDRP